MERESIARKTVTGTLYNYLGTLVSAPLALIASIVLVRRLSLADYGIYSILTSFSIYLLLMTYLGVPNVIQRYLPEELANKRVGMARKIVAFGLLARFALYSLVFAAIALFLKPISRALNAPEIQAYLPVFFLIILGQVVNQTFEAALGAMLEQRYFNLAKISYYAFRLAAVVLALLFDGLRMLLWALLCAEFFFAALGMIRIGQLLGSPLRASRPPGGTGAQKGSVRLDLEITSADQEENSGKKFLHRAIKYGLYTYFSQIGQMVLDASFDVYLISYFMGVSSAGLYSFSYYQVGNVYSLIPTALVASVLVPAIVKRFKGEPSQEFLQNIFLTINKLILLFTVPVSVFLLVLPKEIISLVFDSKYLEVRALFAFWAGMFLFSALGAATKTVLYVTEKVNVIFYSQAVIIYNFVMDMLLIPKMGLWGAATATGSSMFFSYLIKYALAARSFKLKFPWLEAARTLLNCVPSVVFLLFIRDYLTNLWTLVGGLVFAAILYAGVSYMNLPLSRSEVRAILSATPLLERFAARLTDKSPSP